jgi:antitoxin VapB
MATITLHDVPETLHQRLQQRASIHHRPIDKEVILLLEQLLAKGAATAPQSPEERFAAIMEISRRCAALPELDPRSADEIVGYDENGWPA